MRRSHHLVAALLVPLVLVSLLATASAQPALDPELELSQGPAEFDVVVAGGENQPIACITLTPRGGPVVVDTSAFGMVHNNFQILPQRVSLIQMARDNGDGAYNPAHDEVIANGQPGFTALTFNHPGGWVVDQPVTVFVVYTLTDTVSEGQEFQLRFDNVARLWWNLRNGEVTSDPEPLTFDGVTTVTAGVTGSVLQQDGPVSPATNDAVMAILDVHGAGLELESLTLERTAGDATQFGNARLVVDTDGDGQVGGDDTVLGIWGDWENRPVQEFDFQAIGLALPLDGSAVQLLAVADFAPVLSEGMAFTLTATEVRFSSAGVMSLNIPPMTLTARAVRHPALHVSMIPLPDREAAAGDFDVRMAVLEFVAVDGPARVHALQVTAVGQGADPIGIARLRLVHDVNRNGLPDGPGMPGGDAILGTGVFLEDNGSVLLPAGEALDLPPGGRISLLVIADFSDGAAPGEMYGLQLTGVIADGAPLDTGLPLTASPVVIAATPQPEAIGGDDGQSDTDSQTGGGEGADDTGLADPVVFSPNGCNAGRPTGTPAILLLAAIGAILVLSRRAG